MPSFGDPSIVAIVVVCVVWLGVSGEQSELSDIHRLLNKGNPAGIGCLIKVHTRVEHCKQQYLNGVTAKQLDGHDELSEPYRQQKCCGYWTLRDCVANSVHELCEQKSARLLENTKIYQSDDENVLKKECVGFEYGSAACDSAAHLKPSPLPLVAALMAALLITLRALY